LRILDETSVNGLTEQTTSIVHKFYDTYVGFTALNKANFSASSLNLRRTRCNFETLCITMRIASWSLRVTPSNREGKYLHTWRNVIKEMQWHACMLIVNGTERSCILKFSSSSFCNYIGLLILTSLEFLINL